jgi:dihydrofolate synthase/folylpolyglutamate synthase
MSKKQSKTLDQWLIELETKHNKKIDLGLSRVKLVYDRLELEKVSPFIITVAGTNGKGSTVSILSSICQHANYTVGEFTSPHILFYNERIKINGKQVDDIDIISAFELIEDHLKGITLSYFEYSTLAAAIIFKKHKVDISIFEVGLGGRLDSVNIIDSDCAIITTVDIDHISWLGDDVESIGYEKAGVFRSNSPAIYGDINCPHSVQKHSMAINSKLIRLNQDYNYKIINNGFNYKFNQFIYNDLPTPNIKGDWQYKNAASAITALKSLDLNIEEEHIINGLKTIQIEGRLQLLKSKPDVYLDVSHNAQAAKSLSNWLELNPIDGKTFAVFAVLADKEPLKWLHHFKDTIDTWFISEVDSDRALKTNDLLIKLSASAKLILSFETVPIAFNKAILLANENDRIVVFGSFYTVSEVYQLVNHNKSN